MKMTFETALAYLKQGKKIRRPSWPEGFYLVRMRNTVVVYDPLIDHLCAPEIDGYELLAEDWEVVE
jgi:hypothetical protein